MATRMKEKSEKRANGADKRPRATAKYIRISPYKVRIVLDVIRGLSYTEAAAVLRNTNKSAAPVVLKVLESAAANAEYKNISKSDLFVAEAFADQGPTLKRIMPRAKGRAYRILKRTSHITVIVDSSNK